MDDQSSGPAPSDMRIDPKTFGSLHLALYSGGARVGLATGFVVRVDGLDYLVTNLHVVSGLDQETGTQMGASIPDRILVPALAKRFEMSPTPNWRSQIQLIKSVAGESFWVEHPTLGKQVDLAAIPVEEPKACQFAAYDFSAGPEVLVVPASEISVIGFPNGLTGPGITPIWKTGHVASEIDLSENWFLTDVLGVTGMSGSPVIARRFGSVAMADGSVSTFAGGPTDRVVGVYSGRLKKDLSIGKVWKWSLVVDLVRHAHALRQANKVRPVSAALTHYFYNQDVGKNNEVIVATWEGESASWSIANLIRKTMLRDARFGDSIESLETAARIEAACVAAEDSGLLELTGEQRDLIIEIALSPRAWAYNEAQKLLYDQLIDRLRS